MRKLDCLEVTVASRERRVLKESWIEIVINDLKAFNLTNKIALDGLNKNSRFM